MSEKTVTRADLAEAVYAELGVSRQECSDLVESMLALLSDELAKGETVKLSSFGSFAVRDKGERVGRNPKTKQEVMIDPRRVLVFKPSQVLKDRVDGENRKP
jgi:integration host factor subunit alpha